MEFFNLSNNSYLCAMFLKRIISLFIAMLLLFAESGQVVYAHTCFKSNKTTLSLYTPAHCADEVQQKSCCGNKHTETTNECVVGKKSCCAVSATYVKQSFPANETELRKVSFALALFYQPTFFVAEIFFLPPPSFSFTESPPIPVRYPSFFCIFRC